jgi:hypothetical protein
MVVAGLTEYSYSSLNYREGGLVIYFTNVSYLTNSTMASGVLQYQQKYRNQVNYVVLCKLTEWYYQGRCYPCEEFYGAPSPQSSCCTSCLSLALSGDPFNVALAYQLCDDPLTMGFEKTTSCSLTPKIEVESSSVGLGVGLGLGLPLLFGILGAVYYFRRNLFKGCFK